MKDMKYIFGVHPVVEALKAAENIDKVFLLKGISPEIRKEIMQLASQTNIPVQFVPIEKMKRLAPGRNHQGVIALVSPIVFSELEPLVPWWFENGIEPLIVVLDEVTDVHNLGAIARTAECAGAHGILVPSGHSAQINAQTVKISAGALYNIPLCRTKNLKQSLRFLKESGFQIVACTEKAAESYTDISMTGPLALVFGSEETGISPELLRLSDHLVKIPMYGAVGSLNVSVSAGIILFEAASQRSKNK